MSKNHLNYDEIQNQHLDTMIQLAFLQEDALEAQDIMSECAEDKYTVNEKHARAVYNIFLRKLAIQMAEEKHQHLFEKVRRSIPRIIQIAACLVLIIGISAPFAIANVEAIRVSIMELLISIQNDHTELSFTENEKITFFVPTDWQGTYYPAYIPEGYTVAELGQHNLNVRYQNSSGSSIYFSEYSEGDSVNINSESATISYATINSQNALIVERENRTIIAWNADDRFFVLMTDVTKDDALAIARSVRKILFR